MRPSPRGPRRLRFVALVLLLLAGGGCVSTLHVQDEIVDRMRAADFDAALETLESNHETVYRGRNALLYHLERGMLLHVEGRPDESNEAFERAKRLADRLYARSLSELGFSMFANDSVQAYAGEHFERTLVHLFKALNYVLLGDRDSALVEVRQVGDYLRKLQVDSRSENVYQDDAFARYLSALLYEIGGEDDAALVDFKKAASLYARAYAVDYGVGTPVGLLPDAMRVAERLGAWAEADLAAFDPAVSARRLPEGAGEIVVLHYNGLSPIKDQDRFAIPFHEAWPYVLALETLSDAPTRDEIVRTTAIAGTLSGVDVVTVAFPKFVPRPYSIDRMQLRTDAALEIVPPALVEDIGAIAEKDLADRIVRIRAKAIARAAIKYAAQKAVERAALEAGDEVGALLAIGAQIGGGLVRFASEQADQRVWSTLPDEIWMATLVLPEGRHDIGIDFLDARRNVVESRAIDDVPVVAGSRRFVVVRTVQ